MRGTSSAASPSGRSATTSRPAWSAERIFDSADIREQAYAPVLAVLNLTKTYSESDLEAACAYALERAQRPRYRLIRSILASGAAGRGRGPSDPGAATSAVPDTTGKAVSCDAGSGDEEEGEGAQGAGPPRRDRHGRVGRIVCGEHEYETYSWDDGEGMWTLLPEEDEE